MLYPAEKWNNLAQPMYPQCLELWREESVSVPRQSQSTIQSINQSINHITPLQSPPLVPSPQISFIMGRWRKLFTFVKELTV